MGERGDQVLRVAESPHTPSSHSSPPHRLKAAESICGQEALGGCLGAESWATWERSGPQRTSGLGPAALAVCAAVTSLSRQDIPRLLWPASLH